MPLTTDQLDNWFTYHAPTEETSPRYAAIRCAEIDAADICGTLHANIIKHFMERVTPAFYGKVNAVTRALAEVIDANAPDCADKTAAIRCVRLARNAMNECAAGLIANAERGDINSEEYLLSLAHTAREELYKARWQANSAIACGGK